MCILLGGDQGGIVTKDDVQAIRESDDPYAGAMARVETGEATLLEFDKDFITGRSGKVRQTLARSDASQVGGWRVVYNSVMGGPEELARSHRLYFDDSALIVAGGHQV